MYTHILLTTYPPRPPFPPLRSPLILIHHHLLGQRKSFEASLTLHGENFAEAFSRNDRALSEPLSLTLAAGFGCGAPLVSPIPTQVWQRTILYPPPPCPLSHPSCLHTYTHTPSITHTSYIPSFLSPYIHSHTPLVSSIHPHPGCCCCPSLSCLLIACYNHPISTPRTPLCLPFSHPLSSHTHISPPFGYVRRSSSHTHISYNPPLGYVRRSR